MHQAFSNALSLPVRRNGGVQQEAVNTTIADNLGKTDESFAFKSTNIHEGMLQERVELYRGVIRPCSGKQAIEFIATDLGRNLVICRHVGRLLQTAIK